MRYTIHTYRELPRVGVGAHVLGVLQPQRRDSPQLLRLHHGKAAGLVSPAPLGSRQFILPGRHLRHVLQRELVVHPDHVAEERRRGERARRVGEDRPPHDHVGVDDEHVVLLDVRLCEPVDDGHRLVIGRIPVSGPGVHGVVGRHVRRHKVPRLRGHGLPLFRGAAHDPREGSGLSDLPVAVHHPDGLPHEVQPAFRWKGDVDRELVGVVGVVGVVIAAAGGQYGQ